MKPRQQRMLAVGLAAAGIAIAVGLTLRAFEENMMFYVEISEVAKGSVRRSHGELQIRFTLTDLDDELDVLYSGILPDLFREGQGIIAHGRMNDGGDFVADEVLAKHDENYMPPEVAETLAKHAAAKEAAMNAEGETR